MQGMPPIGRPFGISLLVAMVGVTVGCVSGSAPKPSPSSAYLVKYEVMALPSQYAQLEVCADMLSLEGSLPAVKSGSEEELERQQEVDVRSAEDYCEVDALNSPQPPSPSLSEVLGNNPAKAASFIREQAAICHHLLRTVYADCRV
jgi:hypothetical protein